MTARELAARGLDSATIHEDTNEYTRDPEWIVYGHGEYEESSVLAGTYRRVWLDRFPTLAAARAAYPSADVIGGLMPTAHVTGPMPDCPPADFHPDDAGETW